MNVIAIFDVGKTNKKLFLFDEQYKIIGEEACMLSETKDDEGETCEDLDGLTAWVMGSLSKWGRRRDLQIRAVNFSAYGASLVHIGADGRPVAPLYNYLKPYPAALKEGFYAKYGGEVTFSMLTASPVLGSLNSGMQLYRIKHQQPALFDRIKYSLHLPQYLAWLLTGIACSELTSIGCHTNLWNFSQQHYHEWVYREGIFDKLAPMLPPGTVLPVNVPGYLQAPPGLLRGSVVGIGLHDSSAAMIPYLESFREPFVLISTGTWCISMNPFNNTPLTVGELKQDCLCYMSFQGNPVKSARLFAGYEHEQAVKQLAEHYHKALDYYTTVAYDQRYLPAPGSASGDGGSKGRNEDAQTYEEAYHRLLADIMEQQVVSTQLVLKDTLTKRIFVDGGFGKNPVYMHLLAEAFPDIEVFAASIPQASAMGAALAVHRHWNKRPLPGDIIDLKYYR